MLPAVPLISSARSISTSFAQATNGTLLIKIGGTGLNDRLLTSGSASLGGTLNVTTNGYTPVAGNTFTVFTASVVSGTFGTTNLPPLTPVILGWSLQYLSNTVVLSVTSAPTGYNAWAGAITNGLTNFNDSATQDGYPNLLKYATGSSPTDSDGLAAMNAERPAGVLVLKFNRNTNALDTTLIVEGGNTPTNSATWTAIATNAYGVWSGPASVSETGSGNPVAVAVEDTSLSATNRFLRLRVTRP